jgi:putative ABC transport system permease protein
MSALRRNVVVAFRSLSRQRRRSTVMTIGVAIGVAVLSLLSSIGESTRQETLRRFKRMLGPVDTLIVRPGGQTRGMPSLTNVSPTLKFDDGNAIAALDGVSRIVEVQNAFDIDITHEAVTTTVLVFGVTPSWSIVRDERVADGSFISDEDARSVARVAILGAGAQRALFGSGRAIGRGIRIADVPFEVKGVLAPRGSGPGGGSLDDVVYVPLTTSSQRLFRRDYLTMLFVQLRDAENADRVIAAVRGLLRERHHLPPNALDDFGISSPRAMMARVGALESTLSRVLLAVSILALVIGAGVIAGLMQIAVRERTKEIGIRRSVGASATDMLWQFLLEASLVAIVGGVAGLLLGVGAAAAIGAAQKLPMLLLWRVAGVGLLVSIVVGVLAGLQPAIAASRIDVIRAVRSA